MLDKDPTSYSYITYFWVFGLALWGGVVNFFRKVKDGAARAWNITEFLGELLTSALSGVITFYLCELSGTPQLLTAVFVAISGHMGTRLIFLLEKRLEDKANNVLGDSNESN